MSWRDFARDFKEYVEFVETSAYFRRPMRLPDVIEVHKDCSVGEQLIAQSILKNQGHPLFDSAVAVNHTVWWVKDSFCYLSRDSMPEGLSVTLDEFLDAFEDA
jgi:hypothetical protein